MSAARSTKRPSLFGGWGAFVVPRHYPHAMPKRHPVRHPYAEIHTQNRWVPALILAWIHGGSGDVDAWFAEVVINSINEPGHPVELKVAAQDVRPVRVSPNAATAG